MAGHGSSHMTSAAGGSSSASRSMDVQLGEITNLLGTVVKRLEKTEMKLQSIEEKLNSSSSSSAGSSVEKKMIVPQVVRVSIA